MVGILAGVGDGADRAVLVDEGAVDDVAVELAALAGVDDHVASEAACGDDRTSIRDDQDVVAFARVDGQVAVGDVGDVEDVVTLEALDLAAARVASLVGAVEDEAVVPVREVDIVDALEPDAVVGNQEILARQQPCHRQGLAAVEEAGGGVQQAGAGHRGLHIAVAVVDALILEEEQVARAETQGVAVAARAARPAEVDDDRIAEQVELVLLADQHVVGAVA